MTVAVDEAGHERTATEIGLHRVGAGMLHDVGFSANRPDAAIGK